MSTNYEFDENIYKFPYLYKSEYNDQYLAGGHFSFVDGYSFTSLTKPFNIHDAIILRNPELCDCWSPKYGKSRHSLEEQINYVNEQNIKKACVIAESIDFLKECNGLEYLWIYPADTAPDKFDYSPLYTMTNLKYLECGASYGGSEEKLHTTIDYSRIPSSLEELIVKGKGHLNYDKLENLKSLDIFEDKKIESVPEMASGKSLERLRIFGSGLRTLEGIEKYKNLKSLILDYDRRLVDLSALESISETLTYLEIENCSKIKDFSFLKKLNKLKNLTLLGSNEIDNLGFINNMPDLEDFTFSIIVIDGNLNPCLNIPNAFCINHKRHYNIKLKAY